MPRLPTSQKWLLALAIAGVFAMPGCKRASEAIAERAIEQASGDKVDIEQDGGTVRIKTEQGEIKVASALDGGIVALPAGFPGDVFLPESRTLSSAMDMGGMQAVNIATAAAPAQVAAEAEASMLGQGWKREMSMQSSADSTTLIYSKDRRQVVYQLMQTEDGGTRMAVRTGGED